MDVLNEVRRIYRERGLSAVLAGCWIYSLQHSSASGHVDAILGDELVEKLTAAPELGYWPQLDPPRSFNEHLLHRKHRTDEPLYSTVADKQAVRQYVEARAGSAVLNDVYHVTDDPATIPFDNLPEAFVIKGTHGSGMNRIVHDKTELDSEAVRRQCARWLTETFGRDTGEYWYRRITPKILVEELLEAEDRDVPVDYKVYVFDGRAEYVHVDFDRYSDHTRQFYDRDWNPQEFSLKFPGEPAAERPPNLAEMLDLAETIGSAFDFVRVDLYNPREGVVRFGELTIAPEAGQVGFDPVDADFELGALWPEP